jgi:hypothetical protein
MRGRNVEVQRKVPKTTPIPWWCDERMKEDEEENDKPRQKPSSRREFHVRPVLKFKLSRQRERQPKIKISEHESENGRAEIERMN